jgi:hypothetical protein
MTNVLLYILLILVSWLPSFAQAEDAASGDTASTQSSAPAAEPAKQTAPAKQTEPAKQAEPASKESSADSAASQALKASKEEEEKKKQQTVTEVVPQEGGVITGKFELDVTETYTHLTLDQLYISGFGILPIVVVGDVNVQKLRRDIFTTTLTANYKLTDKMQVSLAIPYQHSITRVSQANGISGKTIVSANDETVSQSDDLGDITASLNYQLMAEGIGKPTLYGGLAFKARNGRDVFQTPDAASKPPPGSGFYSLRGSLSASKSSAPAVVFGAFSYAYNFGRKNVVYTPKGQNATLIKTYQPGPSLSLSGGVALSLNYDLAINFSFAQSWNYTSRINGNVLANSASNSITFRMGGIWRLNKMVSIDLSGTMGLSPDAPDYTLALRIPIRF